MITNVDIDTRIYEITKKIMKIDSNITKLNNSYNQFIQNHEDNNINMNIEFENIICKIKNVTNNNNHELNEIIIDIKKTISNKLEYERNELEMYRTEKELTKNKKNYEELIIIKEKLLEEQKLIEDLDIRQSCNICYFKNDKFISCNICNKDLCLECYYKIKKNNLYCPYCRKQNTIELDIFS